MKSKLIHSWLSRWRFCQGIHGVRTKENQPLKPAVKGTSMTVEEVAQHIAEGEATSKAPHNKGVAGLSDAEAKSIAEFIKTLK